MEIVNIPIDNIVISKYNVRKSISKDELENLANSIKENVLLQPIIVTLRNDKKYVLIAGQRRYFACKDKLHWKEIPAYVLPDVNGLKIVTLSTVENLQRVNLSQVEKMDAFSTIYKMYKRDIEMVAKTTGYTKQTIQVYLDLHEGLNNQIKQDIADGKIVIGNKTLVALTKNKNILKEKQNEVLKEIIGVKNQDQQIELINSISDEKTREKFIDRLRGREMIQKLALKIFLYRADNIINDSFKAFFTNIVKQERELIDRFKELQSVSPLYSILLDIPKNRHLYFNLETISNIPSKQLEDIYRKKIRHFEYRSDKIMDLVIEDFKKNKDEYSDDIKYWIFNFLKEIQDLDVFRQRIKEFLNLL